MHEIPIHNRILKPLLLFSIALAFVATNAFLAINTPNLWRRLFAALFFGIGTISFAWKLFNRPQLVLNEKGLQMNALFNQIPSPKFMRLHRNQFFTWDKLNMKKRLNTTNKYYYWHWHKAI